MGMTREGLADDLNRSYSDWGDVVTYGTETVPGFLERTSSFEDDGVTKPGTTLLILHAPRNMAVHSHVTVNGVRYELASREQEDGEFTYRLTR